MSVCSKYARRHLNIDCVCVPEILGEFEMCREREHDEEIIVPGRLFGFSSGALLETVGKIVGESTW